MPILKCPNCSTLNSFTARCCRHCGTKLRNQVTNYSDKDSKKIDTTLIPQHFDLTLFIST